METVFTGFFVSALLFLFIFDVIQNYKTQKSLRNTLDSIETSLRCIKNHYINK